MGKKISSFLTVPSDNWRVRIGTSDKKKHDTIYFEFSSFISPLRRENPCSDDMESLRRYISEEANRMIGETGYFGSNFIVNFQIPDMRMCFGKKSYLLIQVYLKCLDEDLVNMPFSAMDRVLGKTVSGLGERLTGKLSEMMYSQHSGRYQE